MTKFKHLICAATCLTMSAGAASAAVFNFDDMADAYTNAAVSNGDGRREATYDQMVAFNAGFFTDDGISITDITSTGAGSHPFFDSNVAGLGVCSSGIGGNVAGVSNCSSGGGTGSPATGDDNVTAGETVTLTFGTQVALTDLFFRDAKHRDLDGSLNINGASYAVADGMLGAGAFDLIGSSLTFNFEFTGDEFYLTTAAVTAVPVPAGLLLMGTALGGLGLMRRRRKAS